MSKAEVSWLLCIGRLVSKTDNVMHFACLVKQANIDLVSDQGLWVVCYGAQSLCYTSNVMKIKVDTVVSHIYFDSKFHVKCKCASQLVTATDLSSFEAVQKCLHCQLCILRENSVGFAVADPGFSEGGCANSQNCYYFSDFCQKLHENERIWRGARPWRPPGIRQWVCDSYCGPWVEDGECRYLVKS